MNCRDLASDGCKLAVRLLEVMPEPKPVTRVLFTLIFAAGYVAAMKGMDRARFIESCEDAYDLFKDTRHVKTYRASDR